MKKNFSYIFIQTLFSILLFFIFLLIVFSFFSKDASFLSAELIERHGVLPLYIFVFLTDAIISPLPPDIALIIINQVHLNWWMHVFLLGLTSSLSGSIGWLIGKTLHRFNIRIKFIDIFIEKNKEIINKGGFSIVLLSALTPIPFSVASWSVGYLKMRWPLYFLASLFRIPRFFIYYFIIVQSMQIANPGH